LVRVLGSRLDGVFILPSRTFLPTPATRFIL